MPNAEASAPSATGTVGTARHRIVSRRDFSDTTFLVEIREPWIARAAKAGQFVIVMAAENGERIPLTLADFDAEKGTITLVVQVVGKTTRQMQQDCRTGTSLSSVVGPMGQPSLISGIKKAICVGGGLGVAPIFPQVRALKQHGAYVIGVLGFRSKALIFWQERFAEWCDEYIVCTDDGSAGIKGLVTRGIEQALEKHADIDHVIAIGPPVMMRACAESTRSRKVSTVVSLNPVMIDGTGMCGGCRVKVGEKIRFACVDGPEFDAHQVDFDDLTNRLRRFQAQEQVALQRWSENCRMAGGGS